MSFPPASGSSGPARAKRGFVLGPARTLLINAEAGFGAVIVELGTTTSTLELPGPDVPVPDPDRIASVSARHGIQPPPPA